jgi:type I restriction enzyme S subunit
VLKGWTFVLPPLAEQRHIVTLVEALLGVCDELESALAATEAERVRLLDALLNEAVCESGEEIATSEKSVLQVLGV